MTTYKILGDDAIRDYHLLFTAINSPKYRLKNVTYLLTKRWTITNIHPSLLGEVIEEICKILTKLQQDKFFNTFNYSYFAMILDEIEEELQDRILFLETRRILEE